MGCTQSHDFNDITENGINRFRVQNDDSNQLDGVRFGILEISSNELILHRKHFEPIRWSFNCLRRYGVTQDMFLFESGRRCTTGPGLFAFKCRRADILNNTFQEKLAQSSHGHAEHRANRATGPVMPHAQTPTRYSEGIRPHLTSSVEPYLIPITQNGSAGSAPNGGALYVNQGSQVQSQSSHNYINANGTNGTGRSAGSSSVEDEVARGRPPIREINYAVLDLHITHPTIKGVKYVDINNGSSDEEGEDDAFLPADSASVSVTLKDVPYVNVTGNGNLVSPTREPTSSVSRSTHGYTNIESSSGPVGLRWGLYSESSGSPANKSLKPHEASGAQYTKIDFQKTAALASTTKTVAAESTQEGVRKTRHDSAADNLDP